MSVDVTKLNQIITDYKALGLLAKPVDALIALNDGAKVIFGDDIDLTDLSFDAYYHNFVSQIATVNQQTFIRLLNEFNPKLATGTTLDIVGLWRALKRKNGTKTTISFTVLTNALLNLDANEEVTDGTNTFYTTQAYSVQPNTTTTITAEAQYIGNIEPILSEIPKFTKIYPQIITIDDYALLSAGTDTETDVAFRKRLENTDTAKLYELIANIDGVSTFYVYENNTNSIDSNNVNPHTLAIVVQGGDTDTIHETIALNKGDGVGLQGNVSKLIPLYDQNGIQRSSVTSRFYRPEPKPIFVNVVVTNYVTNPPAFNELEFKQYLSENTQPSIGASLISNQLVDIAQKFDINRQYDILMGLSSASVTLKVLHSTNIQDQFVISEPNIKVTIV